jgi:hypothetical protein
MANLKPAPLWLTPQVVRTTLGVGNARNMQAIPVQSLSDCGSRCSEIRMAILDCFFGCMPGSPSLQLLTFRARIKQSAVIEHLEALCGKGLITLPARKLTEKGRQMAEQKREFRAKITNVQLKPQADAALTDCDAAPPRRSQGGGDDLLPEPKPAALVSEKPKPRDRITERRERLEGAIAFLRGKAVLVQVSDRNAQIRKYRVSGKREAQFAEEVIETALDMGWVE